MHQPHSAITWRGVALVSPLTNPLNFITLLQTLRGKSNCRRRTVLRVHYGPIATDALQWPDVTCGHDCRAVGVINEQIILKYLPINNRQAAANRNNDDCEFALWTTAKYQGLQFLCSLQYNHVPFTTRPRYTLPKINHALPTADVRVTTTPVNVSYRNDAFLLQHTRKLFAK